MAPPDSHQFHDLDQSSPEFPQRLTSLFREEGYRNYVAGLRDDDSARLVEYLDSALNVLTAASPAFWTCLRELAEICGCRGVIPQSCVLRGPHPITPRWPIATRGRYDVYEGFHNSSKVSVQRLRIYSNDREERAKRRFCQEVVLWKRLAHPNIVPLIGATVNPFQVLSAWTTGGELSEYINGHPRADRLSIISNVADGLRYLHSCSVIHGDLKGPSVLVDDIGHARLTDFGLAAIVLDSGPAGSIRDGHAVRWAAPEILDKRRPVSRKSDVYSFAMVVTETFTGKAPFYGVAPTTVAVRVLAGKRPPRPTHQDLTDGLWEMVERCWSRDPQHRPDISEVILCLGTTLALRRDPAHVSGNQAPALRGGQSWELSNGSHCRQSRWAPVAYILRGFRKFFAVSRSASDTGPGEDTQTEQREKTMNTRQATENKSGTPEDDPTFLKCSTTQWARYHVSIRA